MRLFLIITAGVIFLAAATVLFFPHPNPPLTLLENVRSALNQAQRAGASHYAEESYRTAQELMRFGWMEMARQNGRLAPFRNYRKADSLMNLSLTMANQATDDAQKRLGYLDSLTRGEQADFENDLLLWREVLDGSLIKFKAERFLSLASQLLEIGELLISEREYEEARQTIAKGRESLLLLSDMVSQYTDYDAQNISIWQSWVQQTLANSRAKEAYAVIIDKSAHKAYLVRGGKLMHTYICELGYNSSHHKLFAGDGATPEGKYKITAVKRRGSKYYKALLLDYPNRSDRNRFEESKRKGIISPHARIGGFIEIHGEGGKYKDWTEGCIAITNGEMDHLMQYVTVGTPVTIVRRSVQWP